MNAGSVRGMRVTIVGASGFIGRHVEAMLLKNGCDVMCVSRTGSVETSKARWIIGDIADPDIASQAMAGADAVIYLASTNLPASANSDMAGEIRKHVETPVRIAEICSSSLVKKFVYASSGGTIYGTRSKPPHHEDCPTDPRSAYGASKLAVETYLRVLRSTTHLQTTSLRISNPYGEYQTALRGQGFVSAVMNAAYSSSALNIWGDGSVVRDYVYVSDVARALIKALTYDGSEAVMNIGSGVGLTLMEIVRAVEEATGLQIHVRFEAGRPVDIPSNVLDISKARKELDWTPKVDLKRGLENTSLWWRRKIEKHGLENPRG